MKSCPTCSRTYTDASLNFCLEDGTPLTASAPANAAPDYDPHATIRYTDPRDTKSPPAEANRPAARASYEVAEPFVQQGSPFGQQPRTTIPGPDLRERRTSPVWWILGGLVVLGIIAFGVIIMILALASMGSNSNSNSNRANANSGNANRNANSNANTKVINSNANEPMLITDDFSEQKWGTGSYAYGDIWYADNEYHMRAKPEKYLVMYAPTTDYKTGNATVSVTVRSVDGTPAASGSGLIVHGERSKTGQLEDYALLIYTGEEPKYEIIKHKDGNQTEIVPWVASKVIRKGTNPNQLEVRARGSELSFYINGQYVDRIKDSENFRGGIAGLYTSDTADIAFDDLEIKR
jgi:hypothetical protein